MVPLQRPCPTGNSRERDAKVRAEVASGARVEPEAPAIRTHYAKGDDRPSNLPQQRR